MISRWEKGVSLPETLNALKMVAIYGTTVDFLYEDARLDMIKELSQRASVVVKAGGERYE
jgi:transcriptional regulator with XRE-family HTH domain